MKFDIYGRYVLDAERVQGKWLIFRNENGKRRQEMDIVVPSDIGEADVIAYLGDLLHEYASPGRSIKRIK